MKKTIFLFFSMIIFSSCHTATQLAKHKISTYKKMEWLQGRWDIRTNNFYYSENWHKENDTLFTGKSIMLVTGDTVLYDLMNIEINKKYIYLTSKSKINTEGNTNFYKLISIKKNRIIFENPSNTEENRITYLFTDPDKLKILIENKENSVESYSLRRILK
ncbi:MAG TPA: DUF6265 family protein [Bacteroidales bacterium]|nr:DUF6265 family protein [Bacteroidales bacterium]